MQKIPFTGAQSVPGMRRTMLDDMRDEAAHHARAAGYTVSPEIDQARSQSHLTTFHRYRAVSPDGASVGAWFDTEREALARAWWDNEGKQA